MKSIKLLSVLGTMIIVALVAPANSAEPPVIRLGCKRACADRSIT